MRYDAREGGITRYLVVCAPDSGDPIDRVTRCDTDEGWYEQVCPDVCETGGWMRVGGDLVVFRRQASFDVRDTILCKVVARARPEDERDLGVFRYRDGVQVELPVAGILKSI